MIFSRIEWTWKKLVAILAFFGGPAALIALYMSSIPSLSAFPGSDAIPFKIPFVIKNSSPIFDMSNVRLACTIDARVGNNVFKDYKFSFSPPQEIKAGATGNFSCNMDRAIATPLPINVGETVRLTVGWDLKVMGYAIPRSTDREFTMLQAGAGYYWMEGRVLK